MTTTVPLPVADAASVPAIGHGDAMVLAEAEFARVIELLSELGPEEWRAPTVCELWDVRAMAGHMLGMAEAQAKVGQFVHDARAARRRRGGAFIDAMTAVQVAERAALTPAEVIERFRRAAPQAVKARRRTPAIARSAVRMRQDPPFDAERWQYGFLVDIIFTRDPWIHRADICRATGRGMVLTPEHDGRIVADVVAEWARRHGKPFSLTLDGPAGGRWERGTRGDSIDIDAIDFCWTLAGRAEGDGLLATRVPF